MQGPWVMRHSVQTTLPCVQHWTLTGGQFQSSLFSYLLLLSQKKYHTQAKKSLNANTPRRIQIVLPVLGLTCKTCIECNIRHITFLQHCSTSSY